MMTNQLSHSGVNPPLPICRLINGGFCLKAHLLLPPLIRSSTACLLVVRPSPHSRTAATANQMTLFGQQRQVQGINNFALIFMTRTMNTLFFQRKLQLRSVALEPRGDKLYLYFTLRLYTRYDSIVKKIFFFFNEPDAISSRLGTSHGGFPISRFGLPGLTSPARSTNSRLSAHQRLPSFALRSLFYPRVSPPWIFYRTFEHLPLFPFFQKFPEFLPLRLYILSSHRLFRYVSGIFWCVLSDLIKVSYSRRFYALV